MDSEIQKYIDDLINRRLKEIQEVIGPRGSVKDLRTLGARLGSGGLEVSADGTPKSQIEPDGDAFFGSDIDNPETTSLGVFANAQSYNGEDMEAGDLLIGDNSDGVGNAKWDTLTGFLRFRRGSQTRAYMGADGAIYAADGLLQINENGILSNNGGVFAESKPNSSNDTAIVGKDAVLIDL
ncbi:MAG TPA: hypothetical protein VHM28_10875, partial [Anaerolineales bacterium]|nr:hypothetical protein [Anaerolineales bacterium]